MNIKYQVGKDDELKCSKEEQENNKENEVLEEKNLEIRIWIVLTKVFKFYL